ncbi:hypothetical protein AURDEDRAFT_158654 [Auricularia subglabra TFB-10046 SS5]|nr:hypothetical protein AURDEDRAFT_158654 [Auricularia subglabra TFB-10046 SS5]
MAAFPQFQLLAPELQAEISSFLQPPDLLNLMRTAKRIHALSVPNLYHRVDLDILVTEPTEDWPFASDNSIDVRGAQRQLMRTVAAHPEYANYIHDLSWHVFLDDCTPPPAPISPPVGWTEQMFPGLERAIALVPVPMHTVQDVSETPIDFFQRLEMAERVYLNFSRGDMVQELPSVLFPRVAAVHLAGLATERLASSILHSLGRLRELVLDHIHSPEPDFLPRLLDYLAGRCYNLERLALRKSGNARADEPFDVEAEEAVLTRFSYLADACRATLKTLTVALTPIFHGVVFFGPDNRPAHFRQWVLALAFSADWPRLAHLQLEGIALAPADIAAVHSAAPRVHVSVRDAVTAFEYPAPALVQLQAASAPSTKICRQSVP